MGFSEAMAALHKADQFLDPEESDALGELISLFEPYDGDDPEEAKAREHATAHCANCRYETPLMFFPSNLSMAASAAIRLAQCPRCFSTKMMVGKKPES